MYAMIVPPYYINIYITNKKKKNSDIECRNSSSIICVAKIVYFILYFKKKQML